MSWDGTPWVMEAMRSGLTFSCKFTVFSIDSKISYKISQTNKLVSKALTCDGSIFDTEKLGFVVSVDGWVGVGVSWEEWKLVRQIIGLHLVGILYSLMLS